MVVLRLWMIILICCIINSSSLVSCLSPGDKTRTERAAGKDVVQAVVDLIREKCIYPKDRLFLRRLAYVESKDGLDPSTFRSGYYGGIWQVGKAAFDETKTCSGVLIEMCKHIEETLGIHWQSVVWSDLMKPLYSGLAAALYVRKRAGSSTPGLINAQAVYWKTYYHDGQSTNTFIDRLNGITDDDCSRVRMDLVFIIDGSGSIGYINFLKILQFMQNVTNSFTLGPDDVQVAVVSFSDYARSEFSLNTYYDHSALNSAIDSIVYDSGGTETADGIRLARTVFRPYYGGRNGIPKVGIVITDGMSNNFVETVKEAALAKGEGIIMFALGIGSVNKEELNNVASPPNCTHVNILSGFSEIQSMLYEIKKEACRAPITIISTNTVHNGSDGNTTESSYGINETVTVTTTVTSVTHIGPSTNDTNSKPASNTTVMNVKVNCGIVHVYVSYNTPHPGPAFYDIKETATDDRPLALFLNKTSNGKPLYITYVGKELPKAVKDLKNCNDSGYTVSFVDTDTKPDKDVEIVCRENGLERNCSTKDFLKNTWITSQVCPSLTGGGNTGDGGSGSGSNQPLPNPCTDTAIENNELYFPYPYDDTKFIKCDFQGKMYVTTCPDGETYHQGSHSCGSSAQTINGNKVPLDPTLTNPCTAKALLKHQYFFVYTPDKTKFIHCDVWGKAWVMNCPASLVWNQPGQTCVEDTHSSGNPCTQAQLDKGISMFPHPDKHKYIHCDLGLNPWVQSCSANLYFDFSSQNCIPAPVPVG